MPKSSCSLLFSSLLSISTAAACWSQATSLSTIQGTVTTSSGAALPRASVTLAPYGGSSTFVTAVVASPTGTFTISSIPAGTYVLCARTSTPGFLDSCLWGIPRIVVNAPFASGNRTIAIVLKQSSLLKARLNDAGFFLTALPPDKFPPAVTFGIWGATRFIPAHVVKRDATGIDYELSVPSDIPLHLNLYSRHVKLTVGSNSPIAPQGYSTILFFDSKKPAPAPLVIAAVGRLP
jgi:hypothetical protein